MDDENNGTTNVIDVLVVNTEHAPEAVTEVAVEQPITAEVAAGTETLEPPDVDKDIVVIAQNPEEMQKATEKLVLWAGQRIEDVKAELIDYQTNLEIAAKRKWATAALKRAVDRTQKRVEFYEKIEAALKAGYYMIPNFPMDVFAIRTKKDRPKKNETRGRWDRDVKEQETSSSPIGVGKYVDPVADIAKRTEQIVGNTSTTDVTVQKAVAFRDVDFPFDLAKPKILQATDRAMAMKIFDEIGVLPGRPGWQRRNAPGREFKNPDPMVIGRIILKKPPYDRISVSFLVTWFVDTKDL